MVGAGMMPMEVEIVNAGLTNSHVARGGRVAESSGVRDAVDLTIERGRGPKFWTWTTHARVSFLETGSRETRMSKTVSFTDTREVFVPLLNEGTCVLRQVNAIPRGDMRFKLIEPADYDPDEEEWEFVPGSEVHCRTELHAGREIVVARALGGMEQGRTP
jgi:hypothetical protein